MRKAILGLVPGAAFVSMFVGADPLNYPQPSIHGFSPRLGPPGTVITVTGKGFDGIDSAWIGRGHDARVHVLSNTKLQLTVPADATIGSLAVLNPQYKARSFFWFIVTGAPSAPPPPGSSSSSSSSGGSSSSGSSSGSSSSGSSSSGSSSSSSSSGSSSSGGSNSSSSSSGSGSASSSSSGSSTGNLNLAISIKGNQFVDSTGQAIQLRGVNFSGFEFAAIEGFNASDPSGGQAGQPGGPNWAAVKSWGANVARIPLNEASWLGYTCMDTSGQVINPDPGGNYKSAVESQVAAANAAGLYVILDLHWASPSGGGAYPSCPLLQTQMADADHSLAFWTSVANQFKNNPAVMFELFNEPYLNFDFTGNNWTYMMQGTGGSFTGYPATGGNSNFQNVTWTWNIASYQAMINTVRATGAVNPVLVGTDLYSGDLSGWLANVPTDPAQQMAATWHAYPTFGQSWQNPCTGSNTYCTPNYSPQVYGYVQDILQAGYPVLITETGDQDSTGTIGSPFEINVTAFADAPGTASTSIEPGVSWAAVPGLPPIGVIGWAWDVWSNPSNVLITDANGDPTPGYGQFFQSWMRGR